MAGVGEMDGDGLAGLVARAWPDGLEPGERAAVDRLAPRARERLRRRLLAVLSWTEPLDGEARPAGVAAAAELAGLGHSQFHALVAGWKAGRRSVGALGVRAAVRRSRAGDVEAGRGGLVEAALAVLRDEPDLGSGVVRGRLLKGAASGRSPATVLRAVEEARRLLPPRRLGCGIVVDSAGLDLVDPEGLRLRLHAVIDEGTGLVLGWAVATDRSMSFGHLRAADDALGRLRTLDLGVFEPCADAPALDVRFAPGDGEAEQLIRDRLSLSDGPRTRADGIQGRAVVRTLGDRIARLWLGTGWRTAGVGYRTGRRVDLPVLTAERDALLDAAIERHNAGRIAMAREGGRGEWSDATVAGVRGLLEALVALEDELARIPDYGWMT